MSKNILAELVTKMTIESSQFKKELERTTARTTAWAKAQEEAASQGVYANKRLSDSFDRASKSAKHFGSGTIANIGYQVQDFAVQVGNGTSALTAFGQQGSQLAGAFGPAGAVVGAVIATAAAIGGPLVNSIMKAEGKIDALPASVIKRIDEIKKKFADTDSESYGSVLRIEGEKLNKEYEKLQSQIAGVNKTIEKMGPQAGQSLAPMYEKLEGLQNKSKELVQVMDQVGNLSVEALSGWQSASADVSELNNNFGTTSTLIQSIAEKVALASTNLSGSAKEAFELEAALSSGYSTFEQLPESAKALYGTLFDIQQQQIKINEEAAAFSQSAMVVSNLDTQLFGSDDKLLEQNESRIAAIESLQLNEEEIKRRGFSNLLELQDYYITESNLLYAKEYEQLMAHEQAQLDLTEEMGRMKLLAQKQVQAAKIRADQDAFVANLAIAGNQSKTIYGLYKTAAIAQATINTYTAATQALAAPYPWPIPIALAAVATASGLAQVSAIKSQQLAGAREYGGPVESGRTYLVGEKGPELFTPRYSGDITSNKDLENSGTTSEPVNPVVYQFSVNAIDENSVAKFFSRNGENIVKSIERHSRR